MTDFDKAVKLAYDIGKLAEWMKQKDKEIQQMRVERFVAQLTGVFNV